MQKPWVALGNSTLIAFISTTLAVFFGSLIAYGVSRYQMLSEARMFQLLMLRMVPPIVIVAPLSLHYSTLKLLDTHLGLILVYFLTTLPYAVWMTKVLSMKFPSRLNKQLKFWGKQITHDMGSRFTPCSIGPCGNVSFYTDPDLE